MNNEPFFENLVEVLKLKSMTEIRKMYNQENPSKYQINIFWGKKGILKYFSGYKLYSKVANVRFTVGFPKYVHIKSTNIN